MTETASCDCCGKTVRREQIGRVMAYGLETFACSACRGEPCCKWCGAAPGDPCDSNAIIPGCGQSRCDNCQQPAWELHEVGTRSRPYEICDDCYDRGDGGPYG